MAKNKKLKTQNNITHAQSHETNQIEKHSQPIYQTVSFSSPLPPPNLLEDYDRKFPGTAERIIQILEAQGKHRQYIERTTLDANVAHLIRRDAEAKRGQIFGFIFGVFTVLSGSVAAIYGA